MEKQQGVGEFVNALHEAGCKNVKFNIWGTGAAESGIKRKVEEYSMQDRVSFIEPSDTEGLKQFLCSLNADSVGELQEKGKISRKQA